MKPILEKLSYFKQKQLEITELHDAFKKREMELVQEHGKKQDALKDEYETLIAEAGKPFREAQEKYKAECKAAFGISDGERADIVGMVSAFQKVIDLQ